MNPTLFLSQSTVRYESLNPRTGNNRRSSFFERTPLEFLIWIFDWNVQAGGGVLFYLIFSSLFSFSVFFYSFPVSHVVVVRLVFVKKHFSLFFLFFREYRVGVCSVYNRNRTFPVGEWRSIFGIELKP